MDIVRQDCYHLLVHSRRLMYTCICRLEMCHNRTGSWCSDIFCCLHVCPVMYPFWAMHILTWHDAACARRFLASFVFLDNWISDICLQGCTDLLSSLLLLTWCRQGWTVFQPSLSFSAHLPYQQCWTLLPIPQIQPQWGALEASVWQDP